MIHSQGGYFLCVELHDKKKNVGVDQIYFPFGRPGGGAPNRPYYSNKVQCIIVYLATHNIIDYFTGDISSPINSELVGNS